MNLEYRHNADSEQPTLVLNGREVTNPLLRGLLRLGLSLLGAAAMMLGMLAMLAGMLAVMLAPFLLVLGLFAMVVGLILDGPLKALGLRGCCQQDSDGTTTVLLNAGSFRRVR